MPPSEALVHRTFGPVSRTPDPAAGGLGISPTELMRTAKHYGWKHGGPGNDGDCDWLGFGD